MPNAPAAARVSAANPEAEEARPPAVGKVLRVATRTGSLRPAHWRMRSSCARTRRANSGSGVPKPPSGSARQTSSSPPWSSVSTVHWLTQCSSVIEMDVFIGVALARSRAPQYLTKAILAGADTVVLLMRRSLQTEPLGS